MNARKLYQFVGVVIGFALIDYGFNFIAVGLPGAREMTSQFIGVNLLAGGSAAVFISLFFLLRPAQSSTPGSVPSSRSEVGAPGIGIETVVEEQSPPQFRFYKNIEYVGYFMTALGLLAAADLVLQVFISQLYNEVRWWIEVLLVIFGVLAYAIFVSLGRIGSEEERTLAIAPPTLNHSITGVQGQNDAKVPEVIELGLDQFSRLLNGEYEHKLTDFVYDMVIVRPEMINVWRENRMGMGSAYLAGPYEVSSELLGEHLKTGEPIRIGILSISSESVKELVSMQQELHAKITS